MPTRPIRQEAACPYMLCNVAQALLNTFPVVFMPFAEFRKIFEQFCKLCIAQKFTGALLKAAVRIFEQFRQALEFWHEW